MVEQSYTASFGTERTPKQAFDAINDVRRWWGEDIEGRNDSVGDEFIFRVEGVHRTKLRVIERVPDERIAWLVLENNIAFISDQTEWVGTTISFDISTAAGGTTQVRFAHLGLVPDYECYEVCSDAWGHLIRESLPSLIETGRGRPFPGRSVLEVAGRA